MDGVRKAIGKQMSTDTSFSATTRPRPKLGSRVWLPFISTSFATNVWLFALLWPLWWGLGVDQLLLPFFIFVEFIRLLIRSRWQVRLNGAAMIALALAIWWLAPTLWVDPEMRLIFLKEATSIWTQFLILVLFWNCVHTRAEWHKIVGALSLIALYHVVASALFLSGIWRGTFVSLLGRFIPASQINASAFFSSISYRSFGEVASSDNVGLLSIRLNGFTLSYSALSMVCLLLLPLMLWRFQTTRGWTRLLHLGLMLGLTVALVFTESRIAYAALAAATLFYALLWLYHRRSNRPLMVALALVATAVGLVVLFLVLSVIIDWVQRVFIDLRPGSWLVRAYIYAQTLALLPEHWIAGWGTSVRIPNLPNEYAAGTHSSYLGMLFQHGVVGLALYVALWAAVWLPVLQGYNTPRARYGLTGFCMAVATAFFAFNVREVADSWWWDQSLGFVLWVLWGLALTAARVFAEPAVDRRRDETPVDSSTP